MMRPRVKQPTETRTLDVRLGLAAGRAIVTVDSVSVTARGLVAENTPLTATSIGTHADVAQISITGGTPDEVYLVTIQATDDLGDVVDEEVEIHVLDLAYSVPCAPASTVYIDPLAYVHRFGLEEAVRLTDEHGLGRVDARVLHAALVDATAEVDSYLGGRYVTPLSPVPDLVVALTADLARERLHVAGGVPSSVEQRAATARRQLRDLASGTAVLSGATQQTTGSDTPIVDAPPRQFTRDSMAGF